MAETSDGKLSTAVVRARDAAHCGGSAMRWWRVWDAVVAGPRCGGYSPHRGTRPTYLLCTLYRTWAGSRRATGSTRAMDPARCCYSAHARRTRQLESPQAVEQLLHRPDVGPTERIVHGGSHETCADRILDDVSRNSLQVVFRPKHSIVKPLLP